MLLTGLTATNPHLLLSQPKISPVTIKHPCPNSIHPKLFTSHLITNLIWSNSSKFITKSKVLKYPIVGGRGQAYLGHCPQISPFLNYDACLLKVPLEFLKNLKGEVMSSKMIEKIYFWRLISWIVPNQYQSSFLEPLTVNSINLPKFYIFFVCFQNFPLRMVKIHSFFF